MRAGRGPGAALAAALLLAAAIRLPSLDADLPLALEGTNAPVLDAFWYLVPALDALEGVERGVPPAYRRPLHTALAVGVLGPLGARHATLGLVSVVAGLLTLVLAWLAARRALGTVPGALAAGLLALSFPWAFLNRSPLIYSGLAMLMTAGLLLRALDRRGTTAAAWALGLLGVFTYKSLALALLGGLLLSTLVDLPRLRAARYPLILASAAVSSLILGLALMIHLFPEVVDWNVERVERYAAPERGPLVLLRELLGLPATSGLGLLAPGLLLLGLLALPLLALARDLERRSAALLLACLGWVASFALAAALLEYRPLRYFTVVFPPLAILAAWAAHRLLTPPPPAAAPPDRLRVAGAALGGFVWSYAAASLLLQAVLGLWSGDAQPPALLLVAGSFQGLLLPGALGGALAASLALGRPRLPPLALRAVALLLLGGGALLDLGRAIAYHLDPPRSLVSASRQVEAALGPGATLTGPYAPALALGTRVRWGSPWLARDLAALRAQGATHLAIDPQQTRGDALERLFAAQGAPLVLVLEVEVRRQPVRIYRLPWAAPVNQRE